jgi:hypothetical protein
VFVSSERAREPMDPRGVGLEIVLGRSYGAVGHRWSQEQDVPRVPLMGRSAKNVVRGVTDRSPRAEDQPFALLARTRHDTRAPCGRVHSTPSRRTAAQHQRDPAAERQVDAAVHELAARAHARRAKQTLARMDAVF